MEAGMVTGVSRTAIGVAWLRERERQRPDRLFDDPYAAAFLAEARQVTATDTVAAGRGDDLSKVFGLHVVLRTRFYDDYLLSSAAGGCRQIVLPAAGLDSRAFRLAWPDGTRLFELDLPELLEFKERVLAERNAVPRCERTVLPVDLREDWPSSLVDAGFRPDRPSAWLVEGLLVYLTAAEADTLLAAVTALSAPGSRLSCERRDEANNSLLDKARATPGMDRVTALWKGGLSEDIVGWLGRAGWRVTTHAGAALADGYGRPDPDAASVSFLTAVRDGPDPGTS